MEATAPVTVERAAAILGVSPSTIHRRIRSGALRAERATRPQGVVWLVHLPPDVATPTEDLPPPTGPEAIAPAAATGPADAMAALIQATLAPIVAPLVAEQAALRQVVERQADQLVQSAEERGRLATELERARAERQAAERSRHRDVRRLSVALTVLAVLTIAAMLAPAWVR